MLPASSLEETSTLVVSSSSSRLVALFLPLLWWVNTDWMLRRFIQSRRVRAGMLNFIEERLIDWPSMISLRA